MKKSILILSMALVTTTAMGRQIDESEARAIAAAQVPALAKNAARVQSKEIASSQNLSPVYLFSAPAGGFAIIAGDDRMPNMVLAYSESGTLDLDNCPKAMKAWLEEASAFIAEGTFERLSAPEVDYSNPVAPLITTKWNQDAPYNLMTPQGSTGENCPTGCAATAMAQVVNYWEYPKEGGLAEHTYEWNGQTLSVDFRESRYDWGNMADVYDENSTEAQNQAVAKLMWDCGVAIDMDYGDEESATTDYKLCVGLVDFFGYNPGMRLRLRDCMSDDEWFQLVNEELDSSRPILYFGATPAQEGHAFICDGYDADGFYHINWGWGGVCDGYYDLSILDPSTQGIGGADSGQGFSQMQSIITDMRPAQEGDVPAVGFEMILADFDIIPESEESSEFSFEWVIANCGYRPFVGTFVLFYTREGDEEEVEWPMMHVFEDAPVMPYESVEYSKIMDATNFEEGIYHLWIKVFDDATCQFVPVYLPNKCPSLEFEIKDGKVYFDIRPHLTIDLTEIDEIGFYYTSGDTRYTVANMTFNIANTSDIWFVGTLAAVVSNPNNEDEESDQDIYGLFDLPNIGPEEAYEITLPMRYSVKDKVKVTICSCSTSEDVEPQDVAFENGEIEFDTDGIYYELALAENPEVSVDNGIVTIAAEVGCCTGEADFNQGLSIDEESVTEREVVCSIYNAETDDLAATAKAEYSGVWNEIKTLTFTTDAPLEVGTYYAELSYKSAADASGNVLDLTLGDEIEEFSGINFSVTTSGISSIIGDTSCGKIEIYSVSGQRITSTSKLAPGCYIVVRDGKARSVMIK